MTSTRRSVTALTAAAALALGALPAVFTSTSILASGEEPATVESGTAYFDGPTLTLRTTPEMATVTVSGTDLTQEFDGGQFCEITPLGLPNSLLDFQGTIEGGELPTPGLAGFRDGSIGVFEGSNASQCFRVDANSFTNFETLTVGLGSDLSELRAISGTFDLEMKANDNRIRVQAVGDDGNPVPFTAASGPGRDYFEIFTGRERRNPAAVEEFVQVSSARSGDHIAFTLPELEGPFQKVRLTALAGSFTLEGGTDAGASATTLSLVQPADATFCSDGDARNDQGTNFLDDGTNTVQYLNNYGDEESCFPVLLTSEDRLVRFQKPLDVATDAQFLFTITWTLPTGSPALDLATAEVNFEVNDAYYDMPFCPDYLYDELGNLVGVADDADLAALPDFEGDLDGKQYACLDYPRDVEIGPEFATVHDSVLLIGDARMRL